TRFSRDWSSDVCSSDLSRRRGPGGQTQRDPRFPHRCNTEARTLKAMNKDAVKTYLLDLQDRICGELAAEDGGADFREDSWTRARSEERRVGTEGRARWA